jgi:hypothetical protein
MQQVSVIYVQLDNPSSQELCQSIPPSLSLSLFLSSLRFFYFCKWVMQFWLKNLDYTRAVYSD